MRWERQDGPTLPEDLCPGLQPSHSPPPQLPSTKSCLPSWEGGHLGGVLSYLTSTFPQGAPHGVAFPDSWQAEAAFPSAHPAWCSGL